MSQTNNAYKLLRVPATATSAQIEAAYNRLFTEYEAQAQVGDEQAAVMMERLNEAYDTVSAEATGLILHDGPTSRTSRPMASRNSAGRYGPGTRTRPTARSRYVQPAPARSRAPYIVASILSLALLSAVIVLLMTRNSGGSLGNSALLTGDEATRGSVVATVNGQPIYQQDYDERVETDKQIALSDPFFSIFLNNFEGYTGTRALDILKQDALDRLINLEIIQQQARREGLFPDLNQQRSILDEARQRDLKPGEPFEQFIATRNISAQQYNRRVIRNLTYAVMANHHMPQTGTSDARTEAFVQWICDTRKQVDPATNLPVYDVKIDLTFIVENPTCTSGLPPDIPIPGIDQAAPEPISTPSGPALTPDVNLPPGPPAP